MNIKINVKTFFVISLICIIIGTISIILVRKNQNIERKEMLEKEQLTQTTSSNAYVDMATHLSEVNDSSFTRTLLWQNPSPTSAMSAGYEIQLSSSDYDELEIYYTMDNASVHMLSTSTLKGFGAQLISMRYPGSGMRATYRNLEYSTDTLYKATTANYFNYDTMGATATAYSIPVYIYGIKY